MFEDTGHESYIDRWREQWRRVATQFLAKHFR
jgi:hypothetical protein